MEKPNGKIVPPINFINFAEETGLIVPIGEWVFETVCKQAKLWEEQGLQIEIAVNVSGKQLKQVNFVKNIEQMMKKYQVNPDYIQVELTESMLMDDTEQNFSVLSALNELGLKLIIDDFGTGYSNLGYLTRFPVHKLKIDRSFVMNITTDSRSASIVQTIIAMAKNLKLKVVAEGIETKEQLKFLADHLCDEGQGYYLHKPMDITACNALLLQNQA